jgi:hypothetical protein
LCLQHRCCTAWATPPVLGCPLEDTESCTSLTHTHTCTYNPHLTLYWACLLPLTCLSPYPLSFS